MSIAWMNAVIYNTGTRIAFDADMQKRILACEVQVEEYLEKGEYARASSALGEKRAYTALQFAVRSQEREETDNVVFQEKERKGD